jgi:hypothetical protein
MWKSFIAAPQGQRQMTPSACMHFWHLLIDILCYACQKAILLTQW